MVRIGLALGLVIAGCGGQSTDNSPPENSPEPTSTATPVTAPVATPEHPPVKVEATSIQQAIPYGTYTVEASSNCPIDEDFVRDNVIIPHGSDRPGIWISLPWPAPGPGTLGQDLDLSKPHLEFAASDVAASCPAGHVVRTIDGTLVNEETLAVTYRQLEVGCSSAVEACTTNATFRLTHRACAVECKATAVHAVIGADGVPQYTCTCE